MAVTKKAKKEQKQGLLVSAGLAVFFLCLIGFLVKVVLLDPSGPERKKPQMITLIKPPPDQVKQKLPEPEPLKEAPKQAMETPTETPAPQDNAPDNRADDAPPAGDNLAVDGEGGAGDNAFGLGAKKGGRAITLGGTGGGADGLSRLSLLSKYSGYSQKIQNDIDKKVKQVLEQSGGRPKGKHQTVVKITLSEEGAVLKFAVVGPSGNDRLDQAFRTVLSGLKLSEPPPAGMPSSMTLKITMQG